MIIEGGVRRRDRRIWYVVLGVFVMVFLFTFLTGRFKSDEEVGAANASKFDAGYIISDYQMSNYNSMSEAEIQAFLTKKNPCGNTNYGDYAFLSERYPNMKWHFENGHFVCLSGELFGEGTTVGEGETAAHIIYQAAQDYRINPQVLIVLLEKEQGLITDTFPNSVQYRSATGYGCPDTAACDTEYYGFRNQVRHAAALFRTVLDGGWTNYPLGNNYIQYNPNAACGGSVVNIRNLATSALYRYTPYQPNAGALAAGYGQAYCGAYGNRNFYLYFEEWFGNITVEGDMRTEIEKYYSKVGGEESYLGKPVTEEICGLTNYGCYRSYENGYVYWSKNTGVGEIKKGKIFDSWFKQGTEWGPFGYPVGTEKKNEDGTVYQDFKNGTIYIINNNDYVVRDFAKKIWSLEKLGKNLSYGACGLKNGGCYQIFEKGRVYYSEKTGSHIVFNNIYTRWEAKGSENGVYGYPVKEVEETAEGGQKQEFQNGWYIYYKDGIGAYDVSGGIYTAYLENGTEWGVLGYPTSSEQKSETGLTYQTFEHGNIYWDGEKAWVVRDFAASKWEALGGVKSKLGKIVNKGVCGISQNGCYQAFEKGNIYWTEKTGAYDVSGGIYTAYLENGTEWGVLGYPTSSEQKSETGLTYQTFEHGNIYWDGGEGMGGVIDYFLALW